MSVWSEGHEVSVRPLTPLASTSIHGAWQIAATGLPCSKNDLTKLTASRTGAEFVSIHDATRKHKCVEILGVRLVERNIHFEFIALIVVIHPPNLTFRRRHNRSLRAGLVEDLSRFGQFNFLEAIG